MKKPSSTSIFTLQDLEKKQKILEKKSFLQNLKDQKAKQIEQGKSKISEKISSEKSEADTSTTSSTVSTQENDFSLSTSRSNNTSTTLVDDIDILAQNLGLQRTDNPTISFLLRQLATNRARQADNAYITNDFLARARQSDFQFEQHISSLQDHLAAA